LPFSEILTIAFRERLVDRPEHQFLDRLRAAA
jgi:hypothetical protein